MNASDIKIDLFEKLNSLQGSKLEEAYGIFLNFFNSKSNLTEWDELSSEQQKAIDIGVKQLDEGKGKEHSQVIQDIKRKLLNA